MANPVPNFPIVNRDGTPTQYFYAWLLQVRQSGGSLEDLLILQAFEDAEVATDGAQTSSDAVLAALPATVPAFPEVPDAIAFDAPPADPVDDIAAVFADRAPVAEAAPVLRGVLASIPAGFNAGDVGRLYYATDYQHCYRWSGAAWTYGDGDEGSGRVEYFMQAPRAGRWQLCDGSTGITESLANGTAASVAFSGLAAGTMPNLTGTPAYLRTNSAATGTVVAAVAPTISGHTELASTGITVSGAGGATATTGTAQAGLTQTVLTALTSGGGGGGGVTDPQHQHNLTSANAPIAPGEVRHMDALPYYRL